MRNLARILFFLCFVKPMLMIILGLNIFGKERLPEGQFIMVANHNSHLDTLALMSLFQLRRLKQIHPVAAADYFQRNPVITWFSGTFMNIAPIPRDHITKSNNPLKHLCRVLETGDSLIIFPEGSRGNPEEMGPFKSGIAHLIQKNPDIPVVPVFLKGMGRSLPKGDFILVPFFCDVVIGKPQVYAGTKEEIVTALEATLQELSRYDV